MYRNELWNYWQDLLKPISVIPQTSFHVFENLFTSLSEEGKFYHSTQHIINLLQLSDIYAHKIKNKIIVDLSIFYHDVIYKPGRGDNETVSAQWAENDLQLLDIETEIIEEVIYFITATKNHHDVVNPSNDLKYFLDFDLSVLSADRQEYQQYVQNVRKEFSFVPTEHFSWGRKAFMQKLLQLPFIYYTEDFRKKEKKARENINWEMQEGAQHIY